MSSGINCEECTRLKATSLDTLPVQIVTSCEPTAKYWESEHFPTCDFAGLFHAGYQASVHSNAFPDLVSCLRPEIDSQKMLDYISFLISRIGRAY